MSNHNDGSIAPKERINVRYISKVNGQAAEVELPLSLLVTGDLKGKPDDTPLDERQPVAIDKNTFNAVLAQSGIERNVSVPSVLSSVSGARMDVSLKVKSMADLSPDNIAAQVSRYARCLPRRASCRTTMVMSISSWKKAVPPGRTWERRGRWRCISPVLSRNWICSCGQ